MNAVQEAIKEIIADDIKDLPGQMTPQDIYDYYNKDGHKMGWNKVYEVSKEIGHRLGPGNRIYINKAAFVKFVYGEINS